MIISTCFLIVYLESDIYINVGNWHAQAVKEFEEEDGICILASMVMRCGLWLRSKCRVAHSIPNVCVTGKTVISR